MDHTTLTALRGSIEKWEKVAAGTGADNGSLNCPLCQLFYYKGDSCAGCPVAESTGEAECFSTPYDDWLALRARDGDKAIPLLTGAGYGAVSLEAKGIAQREVEFLTSLLPKTKPKPRKKAPAKKAKKKTKTRK